MLKPYHELQAYFKSQKQNRLKLEDKGTYLGITIPHEFVLPLRSQIETKYGLTLKHRNEAHVTVISPPELKKLEPLYSKQDLLSKPYEFDDLEAVCVGKYEDVEDISKKTFFVVIRSDKLKEYRQSIPELRDSLFHPHITVGFTDHDLYPEQGAIKDASTCISL
jgi:hypothetical protein